MFWAEKKIGYLFQTQLSHSTSSEQIAEPDPFRFCSNFAHVFIRPKWEILKIFGPLDPLLLPCSKKVFYEKNVKFVISAACDPQKIPKNI